MENAITEKIHLFFDFCSRSVDISTELINSDFNQCFSNRIHSYGCYESEDLRPGLRFRSTNTDEDPRSSFSHQRGKFTRGNPQEFQHHISSRSKTAQIRLASSSSRENDGKKRVKCNVVLYCKALLLLNVCLPCYYLFFRFSVLRTTKTKIGC